MKNFILIVVILLSFSARLFASEEDIVPPYEITISADAGKDFGEVVVKIETNKNIENLKITNIELYINGKWEVVPESAFTDLEKPLLYTTQIRTEAGYDASPWLYIYFELPYRDDSGQWNPKRVHIPYHKGKFESRSITTPDSKGGSKWDDKKL